jgi:hypothetical protein
VIVPRLVRRSLRRGLRWRVLLLFWSVLLVPSAIAALPAFAFLRRHLDHSPRAPRVMAWMDGETLFDLVRRLADQGVSWTLLFGFGAAALCLAVLAPFAAAAMVASALSDEPLPLTRLCAGAGEMYGRMLRTSIAGLLPLGLAGAAAAGLVKGAAAFSLGTSTETAARRGAALAAVLAAALLFVGHLLVDGARAQFAADPHRRSALGALWASIRLTIRWPARVLAVGLSGTAVGLGLAALLMMVRLPIPQSGPVTLLLAWLLAQAARIAIGWGRAARIEGLAELSGALAAELAAGPLQPPPTEVVHSQTLSALLPPRSGAPR